MYQNEKSPEFRKHEFSHQSRLPLFHLHLHRFHHDLARQEQRGIPHPYSRWARTFGPSLGPDHHPKISCSNSHLTFLNLSIQIMNFLSQCTHTQAWRIKAKSITSSQAPKNCQWKTFRRDQDQPQQTWLSSTNRTAYKKDWFSGEIVFHSRSFYFLFLERR